MKFRGRSPSVNTGRQSVRRTGAEGVTAGPVCGVIKFALLFWLKAVSLLSTSAAFPPSISLTLCGNLRSLEAMRANVGDEWASFEPSSFRSFPSMAKTFMAGGASENATLSRVAGPACRHVSQYSSKIKTQRSNLITNCDFNVAAENKMGVVG